MPRRLLGVSGTRLLTATLIGTVLWVTALSVGTVVRVHKAACSSQNKGLAVLALSLTASYQGPHRFNDPIDLANRKRVYDQQMAAIRAAKCR